VRFVRISAALAVVTVALAVPLAVLAGSGKRQVSASFAFGRTGGNIRPFTVRIGKDGRLTTTGPVAVADPVAVLSPALRGGLAKLAQAEGFFAMPALILCNGVNPDVAARFVTISAGGKTRTVTVRGTCRTAFEELYAVIAAAAGVRGP
jgi:hypothetical protein